MGDTVEPAGDAMSLVLEAVGLTKQYTADGSVLRAVDAVDVQVDAGEFVSVMGPSGCGKSTLLHLLGGLDRADSGSITIAGTPTKGLNEAGWARLRRRHVGFVFQAFHLVEELTAVENAELPALLIGSSRTVARDRALQLLEALGVADRRDHLPHQMSGGQQQRVALARALINDPELVLADEPTGSLDSAATQNLLDLLSSSRVKGQAVVLVTHDPGVATRADRVLSMRDGQIVDETRLASLPTHNGWPGLLGLDG